MMNQVEFTDTTIRDGQQSLWAIGMRTSMMLPVAQTLDRAGFASIEVFGNSFTKKMARELGESLWDRIDLLGERITQTPMRVIRSRYLTAFQITPASLDELWYERMAAHGIRQVRVSDASNTPEGWQRQVSSARRVGIDPIVNLIFSLSPLHTDEYYAARARELAKLDVYRICLKDPASLLTPERVRTLIPAIQKNINGIELELHTHSHTGLGPLCCLEAIKLGVRYIDAAIPPLADAASNPSLFTLLSNLQALGYTSSIDRKSLDSVEAHFRRVAQDHKLPLGAPAPYDHWQFIHQVPGGMISNLRHQLSSIGLAHRLPDVLEETARVRTDFGYPIMVTPYSQFIGVQATLNVVSGKRYAQVSDELIQFALGYWGEEERDGMDPAVRAIVLDRPRARELSRLPPAQPTLDEIRQQFSNSKMSDDDLLLCYYAGEDYVASMRAKPPSPTALASHDNLARLITALGERQGSRYVSFSRPNLSFELRSARPESR